MKGHFNRGVITSIGLDHQAPNHLSINVAHGPKKRAKKGQAMPSYDDRPRSNLLVHKRHAKKYTVGSSVKVGMMPDGDADEMQDDGDGDELAPMRAIKKSVIPKGRVY